MKICNNCSTINIATAVRCVQCNMVGNFTYQDQPAEATRVQKETIQCRNCGSHDPGEDQSCRHCHFPLPKRESHRKTDAQISVNSIGRPIGDF